MQLSDAELVTLLQQRSPIAAEQLIEQYADKLYNYVYYHSGDHYLAEDIVSETYIRVIEKINDFVLRDVPFKAWLFRIAHNLLVDYFRKKNNQRNLSFEAVTDEDSSSGSSSDWGAADGGDIAEQIVARLELHQVITDLPYDQRTVFILRFIEGLELEQVAATLDKSVSSVKSLQFRAVQNLRKAINSQPTKVTLSSKASKGKASR